MTKALVVRILVCIFLFFIGNLLFCSSDTTTTGTLSFEIRSTLSEHSAKQDKKSDSMKKFGVQKFGLIAKSEDVTAVLRLLAKTHDIASKREKQSSPVCFFFFFLIFRNRKPIERKYW